MPRLNTFFERERKKDIYFSRGKTEISYHTNHTVQTQLTFLSVNTSLLVVIVFFFALCVEVRACLCEY